MRTSRFSSSRRVARGGAETREPEPTGENAGTLKKAECPLDENTRTVRAQTREPHAQLQPEPRGRGRGRIRPFGPAPRPNPVGRPQTNEYPRPIGPARPRGRPAAAPVEEPAAAQRRTPRATRATISKKKS